MMVNIGLHNNPDPLTHTNTFFPEPPANEQEAKARVDAFWSVSIMSHLLSMDWEYNVFMIRTPWPWILGNPPNASSSCLCERKGMKCTTPACEGASPALATFLAGPGISFSSDMEAVAKAAALHGLAGVTVNKGEHVQYDLRPTLTPCSYKHSFELCCVCYATAGLQDVSEP